MALVRRGKGGLAPRRSLWDLDEDFRQVMERFFDRSGWPGFGELATWREGAFPRVDISEETERITVTAELPGIEPDDVKLELTDEALVISGEKKDMSEEQDEERGWHRTERSYGFFRRVLPLPAAVDRDTVSASFKDGVLTVLMAKDGEEPSKARTIPVTRG